MKPPVLVSTKKCEKVVLEAPDLLRYRINYIYPDGNESVGFYIPIQEQKSTDSSSSS
jgi:hypothetical protein